MFVNIYTTGDRGNAPAVAPESHRKKSSIRTIAPFCFSLGPKTHVSITAAAATATETTPNRPGKAALSAPVPRGLLPLRPRPLPAGAWPSPSRPRAASATWCACSGTRPANTKQKRSAIRLFAGRACSGVA
jgi:hypothetical protein